MERREFVIALGGTAAWVIAAQAQQPSSTIGFLHQGSLPPLSLRAAFRKGLVEAGINEGLTITIEDRSADGQYNRLPALASDLVSPPVTGIAAELVPAPPAAKAASQTIPIGSLRASDPAGCGL